MNKTTFVAVDKRKNNLRVYRMCKSPWWPFAKTNHLFVEERIVSRALVKNTMDDERTEEIQKFLVKHLQLTPRRQLLEEHTKQLKVNSGEKPTLQECLNKSEPIENIDYFQALSELRDFRKNHASLCMSDVNRKRLQREKQREDDFLHGPSVNRKDVDCSSIRLRNLCEKSREAERQPDQLLHVATRLQFAPAHSPALSYQKYKC